MKYYIVGVLAFYGTTAALWHIHPFIAIGAGFCALLGARVCLYSWDCATIIDQDQRQ